MERKAVINKIETNPESVVALFGEEGPLRIETTEREQKLFLSTRYQLNKNNV